MNDVPNLTEKYRPNVPRSWEWQYVFPSKSLAVDPHDGQTRRHCKNQLSRQEIRRGLLKE